MSLSSFTNSFGLFAIVCLTLAFNVTVVTADDANEIRFTPVNDEESGSHLILRDGFNARTNPQTLCNGEWQGVPTSYVTDWFEGGERYAVFQDSTMGTCAGLPDFYPYSVSNINWFIYIQNGPVTIDIQPLVYDNAGTDSCPVPGVVLCTGPQFTVDFPVDGPYTLSLYLSEICCVDGAYFAGIYVPDSLGTGVLEIVVDDGVLVPPAECYSFNDFGDGWIDIVADSGIERNLLLSSEGFTSTSNPDCGQPDNCPSHYNPSQADSDSDDVGDLCDNCPDDANSGQQDADNDGVGDACDECTDTDGDGFGDPGFAANLCPEDNCTDTFNPDQLDADADAVGDLCDECTDTDGDGFGDPGYPANTCDEDLCPFVTSNQSDSDSDGVGNECDNCSSTPNTLQYDFDNDGLGDECDICTDTDGDGYGNPGYPANTCDDDNCPSASNPDQADSDNNDIGDVCDAGCCIGLIRGNANGDPEDKANVADISYLASWLFGIPSGPPPGCTEEANANGDSEEKANVSDISYLVAWLFGVPTGPEPPACP